MLKNGEGVVKMNGIIDFLKILYCRNKLLFLAAILVIIVLAGCSVQSSGAPPPSGPVGGGC